MGAGDVEGLNCLALLVDEKSTPAGVLRMARSSPCSSQDRNCSCRSSSGSRACWESGCDEAPRHDAAEVLRARRLGLRESGGDNVIQNSACKYGVVVVDAQGSAYWRDAIARAVVV
jgi:hypothetical protein